MKTILIIEDEKKIRRFLQLELEHEGYSVITAEDGEEGLNKVKNNHYDIVLLDLMLPKLSGEEVCKEIREFSEIPIIILTAKDQTLNKVELLDMGADDYLTKPFSYNELNGRVKALLRRYHVYQGKGTTQEKQVIYKTGNIEVNSAKRTASIDGEKLNLTDLEYNILEYLLMNKQQVISPSQLFEAIWHEEYYYGANNTIMEHIRHLRQKIEKDPTNPEHIKTIWGKGYYCE